MTRPIVSFVTGTYNRLPLLKALFASIRSQLLPGLEYEFVVCDGGSTDGTLEWLRQQSDVVLIEDGALKGAISAFTRAAFKARGKYVMLLNDDVEVKAGAIIPALVHLESTPECGAIAFKDNRPVPPHYTANMYKVLHMPAIKNGGIIYVMYAQVGMFRKWLGDRCNWWEGEGREMLGARTYGGDNCLSAHIWRNGYTVEELLPCMVEDRVTEDQLRAINRDAGIANDDSKYYYDQWKTEIRGPLIPDRPTVPNPDRRAARILYLPIYDPGWAAAKDPIIGKRGLRDALVRATNKAEPAKSWEAQTEPGEPCIVQEVDYMAIPPNDLRDYLMRVCEEFKPHVILTQIQAPVPITADILAEMKTRTKATIINWNGDVWAGGRVSSEIMKVLRHVDLQTIVTRDKTEFYDGMGLPWAYWQIGYEEPGDNLEAKLDDYFRQQGRDNPYKDFKGYPVVWLGSTYSDARKQIADMVKSFGGMVFSPGDQWASLYNFAAGKLIYNKSKLAIANNDFPDMYGFVSNRMMQILAAGGAMMLLQKVDGLEELTGIKAGVHYVMYTDLNDLRAKITYYLAPEHEQERKRIADSGTAYVREHHSFDARVKELFGFIETKLSVSKRMAESVALRYTGRMKETFSLGKSPHTQIQYSYQPGHSLYLHKHDYEWLMQMYPNQWERMEE